MRFKLADSLKGTFEHWEHTIKAEPEEMSEEQRSMMMDIGSLWRINWDELAKAFLS